MIGVSLDRAEYKKKPVLPENDRKRGLSVSA